MHPIVLHIVSLLSLATALPSPSTLVGPAPYNYISDAASRDRKNAGVEKRNLGGVRLSNGRNFTGNVWYGVYPLDECIGLNDYAHNLLSFRPDQGTECMVMQDECNSDTDYVTLHSNSTYVGDLAVYDWIGAAESYFCMTEMWPKAKKA